MLDKNIKFMGDGQGDNCFALGRQMTIEYYECGATAFLDEVRVEKEIGRASCWERVCHGV